MGLAGEEHVTDDKTIWVQKSHFPSPVPPFPEREFTCDKFLFLTRNPLDVMVSMFLFLNTGSHSMTCAEAINEAFAVEWDQWIHSQIPVFKEYHEYMMRLAETQPFYFFRYEDVTRDSNEVVTDIFRFMLD